MAPDDLLQIRHARVRAELVEHVIRTRRMRELRDLAALVLEVAERDGPRRARLLARGHHVAVLHRALLVLRAVLARDDALHAHRALLHHAELTHGDVGVQLNLERCRPVVEEPVEAAYVIRTVVAAVPGTDTAVVHLPVQAFVGAIRREYRAHRLAGRDLT